MNLMASLVGMAMNVFMAPYEPNAEHIPSLTDAYKEDPTRCIPILVNGGENQMKFSRSPRGLCANCCPFDTKRDVRFVLYTRTRRNGIEVGPGIQRGSAQRAGVRPDYPTEIFIHGFTEPSPGASGRTIVDAYLSRADNFNVILVDWSALSSFPWYSPAVQNVKIVAEALRNFLETYNDSGEIPIRNVHVIGFSLGSHIASFTGKRLRSNMRIPRITALDPALPEYSLKDTSRRIAMTDADFVDVIHTDAGIFGLPNPVGHADFYPNGGRALQPGCQPSYLVQIRLVEQIFACSHVRAWRLYAESVRNPAAFPATKCQYWRGPKKSCNFTMDATMGYASAKETRGQFYLITGYKGPYAKTAAQQMGINRRPPTPAAIPQQST